MILLQRKEYSSCFLECLLSLLVLAYSIRESGQPWRHRKRLGDIGVAAGLKMSLQTTSRTRFAIAQGTSTAHGRARICLVLRKKMKATQVVAAHGRRRG